MTSAKNLCMLFGIVFVIAGVLGFFPNPLVGQTGFFVTNRMHDYLHLATGAAFLSGAVAGGLGVTIIRVMGVVYALLGAAGFFMSKGDMLFGMQMNMAAHWMHLGAAAVMLLAGFGLARPAPAAA
jgi:hypothetical protein